MGNPALMPNGPQESPDVVPRERMEEARRVREAAKALGQFVHVVQMVTYGLTLYELEVKRPRKRVQGAARPNHLKVVDG